MKKIGPWTAFKAGLALARRNWSLSLPFYAVQALLAGLLLLPIERVLLGWIGHRLAAWELANGLDAWLAMETLRDLSERGGLVEIGGLWSGLALISLPAWPFLLSLPFVLLSGGALSIYATPADGLAWGEFWKGLRLYAGPFTLLLLMQVVLLELAMGLLSVLLGVAAILGGFNGAIAGTIIAVVLGVALFLFIPWWFSYARVIAVADRSRRVTRLLGQAASFMWRNLGAVAVLDLLIFALAALLSLLYALLTWPLPTSWWIVQAILQQVFIFARISIRLGRLSTETCLVQGRRGQPNDSPSPAVEKGSSQPQEQDRSLPGPAQITGATRTLEQRAKTLRRVLQGM